MSSQNRPSLPTTVRERSGCMCAAGGSCTSFAPGHGLHLIQSRLAAATPTEWVDALVSDIDTASGELSLVTLEGESVLVWNSTVWNSTDAHSTSENATGATNVVQVGAPVAYHRRYGVLAIGSSRFNVAPVTRTL